MLRSSIPTLVIIIQTGLREKIFSIKYHTSITPQHLKSGYPFISESFFFLLLHDHHIRKSRRHYISYSIAHPYNCTRLQTLSELFTCVIAYLFRPGSRSLKLLPGSSTSSMVVVRSPGTTKYCIVTEFTYVCQIST